jgi:hypothetical protein
MTGMSDHLNTPGPQRTPSESEQFWARRAGWAAVLVTTLGVLIGGNASAAFLVTAVVLVVVYAWLLRNTLPPGGGDVVP